MNNMRSDEQALYSEVDRANKRSQHLKKGVGTAVTAVSSLAIPVVGAGLSKIGAKIMPLLNQYIPANLALKGISKINPELGSFLKKGIAKGLNVQDGLDFIKENIQSSQSKETSNKKDQTGGQNIIEQHSPELHEFISEQLKNGSTPVEAGSKAFKDKKFMNAINAIKNQHKTNWADIVESVYGSEGKRKNTLKKFNEQVKDSFRDRELNRVQNAYVDDAMSPQGSMPSRAPSAEQKAFNQPQQQPQQQSGQAQAALMAILQTIQQKLG